MFLKGFIKQPCSRHTVVSPPLFTQSRAHKKPTSSATRYLFRLTQRRCGRLHRKGAAKGLEHRWNVTAPLTKMAAVRERPLPQSDALPVRKKKCDAHSTRVFCFSPSAHASTKRGPPRSMSKPRWNVNNTFGLFGVLPQLPPLERAQRVPFFVTQRGLRFPHGFPRAHSGKFRRREIWERAPPFSYASDYREGREHDRNGRC